VNCSSFLGNILRARMRVHEVHGENYDAITLSK